MSTPQPHVQRPEYMTPCPYCSYLDVPGCADIFRSPSIIGRRSGGFAMDGCGSACSLCSPREIIKGATEAEVAAAWTQRLAHLDQIPGLRMIEKCQRTLRRLHARGLLPDSFPVPTEDLPNPKS